MALKFLNKKGWHTGSLRNIENVWKAEQKHEAEQRKLEELRKQIQEERERADFLRLQESAGYVPRQERLDFLYESGLAVGKGSSEGFKALQAPPKAETPAAAASEPSSSKAAVPGALFEDKPQSANDAWRKLHSDPLLLIRQREQEAIAHIKNNPIQMAMIKKSVEAERQQKEGDKKEKKKKEHKKHHQSKLKHDKHLTEYSDSDDTDKDKEERSDRSRPKHHHLRQDHKEDGRKSGDSASERQQKEGDKKVKKKEHKKHHQSKLKHDKHLTEYSDSEDIDKDKEERSDRSRPKHHHLRRDHKEDGRKSGDSASEHHFSSLVNTEERRGHLSSENRRTGFDRKRERTERFASEHHHPASEHGSKSRNRENWASDGRQESGYTHHRRAPRLSEEERAARVREMQHDAELHEEQRWKRIKKSSEADAREAFKDKSSSGRNFLDAAQKSMFGTEKGGSSTIEESVRRRTYYSQGGVAAQEINAFRRQ